MSIEGRTDPPGPAPGGGVVSTYTWDDWIDMTPDEVADEHYVRGLLAALEAVKNAPTSYDATEQTMHDIRAIERLLETKGAEDE